MELHSGNYGILLVTVPSTNRQSSVLSFTYNPNRGEIGSAAPASFDPPERHLKAGVTAVVDPHFDLLAGYQREPDVAEDVEDEATPFCNIV